MSQGDVVEYESRGRSSVEGAQTPVWEVGMPSRYLRCLSRRNSFPSGLGEEFRRPLFAGVIVASTPRMCIVCLLYTSDAADDLLCLDLGGGRIIKKKKKEKK